MLSTAPTNTAATRPSQAISGPVDRLPERFARSRTCATARGADKGRGRARGDPEAAADVAFVRGIHLHTFRLIHRLRNG